MRNHPTYIWNQSICRRQFLRGLAAIGAGSALLSANGGKTDVKSVASRMFCPCGCRQILAECLCETAVKLREDLQKMIDQGMRKDAILQEMVRQYGETILAAPEKKGFGLVAYILPLAAFLLGGGVLFFFLRSWSASSSTTPPVETPPTPVEDNLRKEIEKQVMDEI